MGITKPSPNNQGKAQQTRLKTTELRRCAKVSGFKFHTSMEIKVGEHGKEISSTLAVHKYPGYDVLDNIWTVSRKVFHQ